MTENTDIGMCAVCVEDTAPPHSDLRFGKAEKLHHRKAVEWLFNHGKSEYAYPLRMFYALVSAQDTATLVSPNTLTDVEHVQMMVTVPKKKFKHAVDRVWLRRRIREAYRINRTALKQKAACDMQGRFLLMSFIYAGGEKVGYAKVEKKMQKLLDRAMTLFDGPEREVSKSVESGKEECDA